MLFTWPLQSRAGRVRHVHASLLLGRDFGGRAGVQQRGRERDLIVVLECLFNTKSSLSSIRKLKTGMDLSFFMHCCLMIATNLCYMEIRK